MAASSILRNGAPGRRGDVGRLTATPSVGVVALGYVATPRRARSTQAWLDGGRFEIDIAGERVAVRASLKAPYDPSSARTRT